MTKEEREMQRYEAHLEDCRRSLREQSVEAVKAAVRNGATIHPRVAAIKARMLPRS